MTTRLPFFNPGQCQSVLYSAARTAGLSVLLWLLGASAPALAQETIHPHDSPEALQPDGGPATFKLMLCTDGTITGWGSNYAGQLGSGPAYVSTPTPVNVSLPGSVVKVVGTWASSFAILADGTLWAWGDNSYGQLGVGSGTTSTAVAMRVPTITNVVAVTGSLPNTFALCADGTVWSWGYNQNGALGTGTVGPTVYTPQQIPPSSLRNIRSIACGVNFCLALDVNGHVWSWGQDAAGELGTGEPAYSSTIRATPTQIQLNNVRQIDASHYRAVALCNDGTVWTWGENAAGHLGLNNTAYTSTPAQVAVGADAVWIAINEAATIAVRATGRTSVWGSNYYGSLGVPAPAFAGVPVAGPPLSLNTQVDGQSQLFTSIERTGTVKTWGLEPLGYTPSAPTPPGGGSYTPTSPTGICPAVPAEEFPVCGPLRAYYQRSGATYVAAQHGNTGPADLGTVGTATVIDASLPPYNGTVVFDGRYHVRGNVRFINGTFTLLDNTVFYVDSDNGQRATATAPNYYQTTLEVQKATLQLQAATLRASCDDRWGGVVLAGNAQLYTAAGGFRSKIRSVIRDAITGVYNYTPDWTIANTNEYYLKQTDFINDDTGLYDLAKDLSQPGEGALDCLFQDGRVGIQFESVDYTPRKVYGGNYDAAAFDGNTFTNLQYGMLGQAGALHVRNSHFIDNYFSAIYIQATMNNAGEIDHNTIVVPAVWPASLVASLPSYFVQQSFGIYNAGDGNPKVTNNTIEGATATPATNSVQQTGMSTGACNVTGGNVFRNLDDGLAVSTGDYGVGSAHYVVGNTFDNNVNGLVFSGYAYYYQGTPQVTLRCNTFSSTQPGGVGVWVKAGTPFPSDLGRNSQPNGNRFNGITDPNKRFVYDATSPFRYYRYNSPQELFGTTNSNNPGNVIFTYGGGASSAVATNTQIPGTGACGTSTTPGVYARSVGPSQEPAAGAASPIQLSEAYPNPANETVSFTYALPASGSAAELVLRDLMGRCVARQTLLDRAGKVSVSVQHLPAGFYTGALEVSGHRQASHKLTVAH